MRLSTVFALAGLTSSAVSLFARGPTPGILSLPFEQSAPQIRRRDSTLEIATGALAANYIVNITVGTPPQPVTLSLDTGSSDIILLNKASALCVSYGVYCPSVGYYNPNKSSTYNYLNSNFSANFGFSQNGAGSGAVGDVVTDALSIGGATIKTQQFAVAYTNVSIAFSILGLGYAAQENQVHLSPPLPPYDNLPLSLAKQGVTNLALFSLWKDQVSSHFGGILFGGIDTGKYTGSLTTLDIQHRTGYADIQAFDILLNGVKLSGNSSFPQASTGSVQVVLDCGSSGSILPDDWAQPIFDQFGVKYFPANNTAIIDCSVGTKDYTIDFTFEGLTISAPIAGFVVQYSGESYCTFGIVAAGTRQALLGDNFLSNAFTTFDLTNNQISLASRNFGSAPENIVVVPSGGVKDISNPSSTTATPSGTSTGTGASSTSTKKSSATSVVRFSHPSSLFFAMLITICILI